MEDLCVGASDGKQELSPTIVAAPPRVVVISATHMLSTLKIQRAYRSHLGRRRGRLLISLVKELRSTVAMPIIKRLSAAEHLVGDGVKAVIQFKLGGPCYPPDVCFRIITRCAAVQQLSTGLAFADSSSSRQHPQRVHLSPEEGVLVGGGHYETYGWRKWGTPDATRLWDMMRGVSPRPTPVAWMVELWTSSHAPQPKGAAYSPRRRHVDLPLPSTVARSVVPESPRRPRDKEAEGSIKAMRTLRIRQYEAPHVPKQNPQVQRSVSPRQVPVLPPPRAQSAHPSMGSPRPFVGLPAPMVSSTPKPHWSTSTWVSRRSSSPRVATRSPDGVSEPATTSSRIAVAGRPAAGLMPSTRAIAEGSMPVMRLAAGAGGGSVDVPGPPAGILPPSSMGSWLELGLDRSPLLRATTDTPEPYFSPEPMFEGVADGPSGYVLETGVSRVTFTPGIEFDAQAHANSAGGAGAFKKRTHWGPRRPARPGRAAWAPNMELAMSPLVGSPSRKTSFRARTTTPTGWLEAAELDTVQPKG